MVTCVCFKFSHYHFWEAQTSPIWCWLLCIVSWCWPNHQSGVENPPGGILFFNLSWETGCGGACSRCGVKNCPGCPISSPVTGLTITKLIKVITGALGNFVFGYSTAYQMNCINTCWLMIASSYWSICRMHGLFIAKFKVWFHVIFFGWCFGRRRARSGFIWRWCNRASRWRSIRKYWVRAASTSWSFKNPIWKTYFQ